MYGPPHNYPGYGPPQPPNPYGYPPNHQHPYGQPGGYQPHVQLGYPGGYGQPPVYPPQQIPPHHHQFQPTYPGYPPTAPLQPANRIAETPSLAIYEHPRPAFEAHVIRPQRGPNGTLDWDTLRASRLDLNKQFWASEPSLHPLYLASDSAPAFAKVRTQYEYAAQQALLPLAASVQNVVANIRDGRVGPLDWEWVLVHVSLLYYPDENGAMLCSCMVVLEIRTKVAQVVKPREPLEQHDHRMRRLKDVPKWGQ